MKIIELLKEAAGSPSDIVEFKAPFAGESGSDREVDMKVAKFAWKYKCQAVCVERVGPSGGWPEYVFFGPRSGMEKLAVAYNDPENSGESNEMVKDSLKKSKRKYEAISPVQAEAKRKEQFKAGLEGAFKELTSPRDAEVMEVQFDDTGAHVVMGYDFPENRARVPDIKKHLKPIGGKITSYRNDMASRVQPLYDYIFDFDELTKAEVQVMKAVFKK